MNRNPFAANSGTAPFIRNPLPDYVLVTMSKDELRQRRRTGVDTARSQRRSVLRGRRLLKAQDPTFTRLAGEALYASSGKKSL